jgi:hypothetical protein
MSYAVSNKVNVGEESIDHSNIEWYYVLLLNKNCIIFSFFCNLI